MAVTDYNLVVAGRPADLANIVTANIGDGWQPWGDVFVTARGELCQMLIQGTPVGGGGGNLPEGSVAVANGDSIFATSSGTPLLEGTAVVDAEAQTVACELGADKHILATDDLVNLYANGGSSAVGVGNFGSDGNGAFVMLDTVHAVVANNGTVPVTNNGGTDSHNATATVAAGAITKVALAATTALVDNADTASITNSTLSVTATGTATVGGGTVTNFVLGATSTIVNSGGALTGVAPTGTYTNTITFTVSGGVITAVALS